MAAFLYPIYIAAFMVGGSLESRHFGFVVTVVKMRYLRLSRLSRSIFPPYSFNKNFYQRQHFELKLPRVFWNFWDCRKAGVHLIHLYHHLLAYTKGCWGDVAPTYRVQDKYVLDLVIKVEKIKDGWGYPFHSSGSLLSSLKTPKHSTTLDDQCLPL